MIETTDVLFPVRRVTFFEGEFALKVEQIGEEISMVDLFIFSG